MGSLLLKAKHSHPQILTACRADSRSRGKLDTERAPSPSLDWSPSRVAEDAITVGVLYHARDLRSLCHYSLAGYDVEDRRAGFHTEAS